MFGSTDVGQIDVGLSHRLCCRLLGPFLTAEPTRVCKWTVVIVTHHPLTLCPLAPAVRVAFDLTCPWPSIAFSPHLL